MMKPVWKDGIATMLRTARRGTADVMTREEKEVVMSLLFTSLWAMEAGFA